VQLTWEVFDEAGTAALGAALANLLTPQTTLGLRGTLGAGKTRLVRAIAAALGVDPRDVLSPTFVLIHEYRGRMPVFHIDAYRLHDEAEFLALGPDEYFAADGIVLVEWADRVENCLPSQRLEVHIEVTGDQSRRFIITAMGERYLPLIQQLAERHAVQQSKRP
jgi:tRNA threonylcarbamoyladenosine biosynthesis protein TsaE